MATSYRDLIVWQSGMDLVVKLYDVTARFPESERYSPAQHPSGGRLSPLEHCRGPRPEDRKADVQLPRKLARFVI